MIKSGIYEIRNIINNKVYLGSAVNILRRKSQHFYDLINNVHDNKYLQNSYNKIKCLYGKEEVQKYFIFTVIQYIEDKDQLIKLEQMYIDKYKNSNGLINKNKCYNIRQVAESNLGCRFKLSEETKKRMSRAKKGNKNSPRNFGLNNHFYGKHHTEDTINKMKNKVFSPETKKKMSDNHADVRGSKNPNYNKKSCNRRKVMNLTTNKVFDSIKEAANYYNLNKCNITHVCAGRNKTTGGYVWKYYNS